MSSTTNCNQEPIDGRLIGWPIAYQMNLRAMMRASIANLDSYRAHDCSRYSTMAIGDKDKDTDKDKGGKSILPQIISIGHLIVFYER
jgi:hypothetical protein